MDDPRRHLRIVLRPSRTLFALLCFAYSGAAACLLSLDLGGGIMSLMLALLVLSAVCDLAVRAGGCHCRAPREILFDSDGDCRVVSAAGAVFSGRPRPAGLVDPMAVCFTLEIGNRQTLPLIILPDMCRTDDFRKLRLLLRTRYGDARDNAAPGHFFSFAKLRNDARQ